MSRYFNIAGPCNPIDHYMIDAVSRLSGVDALIDQKQYFVIHAARQSGKTTLLLDLAARLNRSGKYYALYCSLEVVQGIIDPKEGIPVILNSLTLAIRWSPAFKDVKYDPRFDGPVTQPMVIITEFLSSLAQSLDKPLVIFFDEADCLSEGTLISFLRQLRNGYNTRVQAPFVHSLALVGMRNIRDFKGRVRPDRETLGSASPFNIVTESLTLQNFTREEIVELYSQHTADTGQVFEETAIEKVWQQTQGQPWLVNAIAREVVTKLLESDYTKPVTTLLVEAAIQNIILRRDTHIDSLLERLKEERIHKIIEPIILGEEGEVNRLSDDFLYTRDLGLIRVNNQRLEIANPIYGEVIVRTLNYNAQEDLKEGDYPYTMPRYLKDGKIDMDLLLKDFQVFWRENGAIWEGRFDYREAAPHLILMAFLQRVVNGGGRITREMAAATRRLDLCIEYLGIKYPIEIKLYRSEKTLAEGLQQTANYMETLGCTRGWLVVFDRRVEIDWESKLYMMEKEVQGKTVVVVGC